MITVMAGRLERSGIKPSLKQMRQTPVFSLTFAIKTYFSSN